MRAIELVGFIFGGALALGCATSGHGSAQPRAVTVPAEDDAAGGHGKKAAHPAPAPVARGAVRAARRPFLGYSVADGRILSDQLLLDELAKADVVCVGEQHDSAAHHYAQWTVLDGLSRRQRTSGREVGLGLEMVPRTRQYVLGRFERGKTTTPELASELKWQQTWGFDFELYRPLIERTVRSGGSLVALNAPRELTRKIAKVGLRGLDDEERQELPRLDLDDQAHREYFREAMSGHPMPKKAMRRYYAAQVVWDETMAQNSARWVRRRQPARQLVIAAGLAHCWEGAIVSRVQRRLRQARVVSVRPLVEGEDEDLQQVMNAGGYDYVLFMPKGDAADHPVPSPAPKREPGDRRREPTPPGEAPKIEKSKHG